jgi:hypothetical protein
MNNAVAASALFARAIELYKDSGSLIGKAECLHGMALAARSEGKRVAARAHLTEALDLYTRASAPIGAARCQNELAAL